ATMVMPWGNRTHFLPSVHSQASDSVYHSFGGSEQEAQAHGPRTPLEHAVRRHSLQDRRTSTQTLSGRVKATISRPASQRGWDKHLSSHVPEPVPYTLSHSRQW